MQARRGEHGFVAGAADLKEDQALVLELDFLVVDAARQEHRAIRPQQIVAREAFPTCARTRRRPPRARRVWKPASMPSCRKNYTIRSECYNPPQPADNTMTSRPVRLYRWDEIALEKVTEMISRKIITGEREMVTQIYLKRGALVPMHSHESEQMTYVLQGGLRFLINGEEITVREGEVLHIPSWVPHQAEAIDDTFEMDIFSPIRQDWLDGTDTYFHEKK